MERNSTQKSTKKATLTSAREKELKELVKQVDAMMDDNPTLKLQVDENERRTHVKRKRGPLTEKLKDTVVYMYNMGCTYKEINQITGAASASINKILAERSPEEMKRRGYRVERRNGNLVAVKEKSAS